MTNLATISPLDSAPDPTVGAEKVLKALAPRWGDSEQFPGQFRSCPCGCGETFAAVDSRGRPRSFFSPACSLRVNRVSGGGEGRRHSDATKAALSAIAKRPKPWLRGERNGMSGRVGPLNPNWRGGGSPERQRMYASGEWRRLRRLLRTRAGGKCEGCGSRQFLHMHHVKPWATHPDLRLDLDNLRLLCVGCHRDEHRKGGVRHQ